MEVNIKKSGEEEHQVVTQALSFFLSIFPRFPEQRQMLILFSNSQSTIISWSGSMSPTFGLARNSSGCVV